jgi:hypothetical protein
MRCQTAERIFPPVIPDVAMRALARATLRSGTSCDKPCPGLHLPHEVPDSLATLLQAGGSASGMTGESICSPV